MLNNYFTIKETAKYLNNNVSGFLITDIFTQEKNKLLIELFNQQNNNTILLEYSIEKGFNYLLVKKHYSKAKKNFAVLFEEVSGIAINDACIFNDDRIICFNLENGMKIIFTFFSNKANCFLIKSEIIINAFKDKSEFLQKSVSEIIPDKKTTASEITSDLTIDKFLKKDFRKFGDLYCREILYRLNLKGSEPADENNISKLNNEFKELEDELEKPEFLLYSNDQAFYLSLIRQNHLNGFVGKPFADINDLLSEFIKIKFRTEKTGLLKHSALSGIKQKISAIEKKIAGIKTQLQHSENSDVFQMSGNVILQNIHLINKGDKTFSFTDDDGKEYTIKLKEHLSPSENAKSYFDKYKKQKGSVEILKSRVLNFEKEKAKLESELERINNMEEYKSLLKEEKKSDEIKNDETSRFRKFRLNEKYEVWVGKDSASNDLLTTKYSAQNDLWFHVRGASGSHTVLKVSDKKADIEKEIINRAASIAAYYSKARNSGSVPVAYCEKKYVKKKKGFKQGSVVMEREKVIFVKPKLPEDNL